LPSAGSMRRRWQPSAIGSAPSSTSSSAAEHATGREPALARSGRGAGVGSAGVRETSALCSPSGHGPSRLVRGYRYLFACLRQRNYAFAEGGCGVNRGQVYGACTWGHSASRPGS
jgi:hypothetical protein